MKSVAIIWGIFAVLFLVLTIVHIIQSSQKLEHFKVEKRPGHETMKMTVMGSDIDAPLNIFSEDFNKYLDNINNSNRNMNLIAAGGYFLAMLTALISLWFSL
jgi:hypothetical protein